MIALGTPQSQIKHDFRTTFVDLEDITERDRQFYTDEAWAKIQHLKEASHKKKEEKKEGGALGDEHKGN
jgi:hypothetical protein